PDFSALAPSFMLAMLERRLVESTGICPERCKYQPIKGIFHNPLRATILNWNGSLLNRSGGAMYDRWFAAYTAGPSRFSVPGPTTSAGLSENRSKVEAHACARRCCTPPWP